MNGMCFYNSIQDIKICISMGHETSQHFAFYRFASVFVVLHLCWSASVSSCCIFVDLPPYSSFCIIVGLPPYLSFCNYVVCVNQFSCHASWRAGAFIILYKILKFAFQWDMKLLSILHSISLPPCLSCCIFVGLPPCHCAASLLICLHICHSASLSVCLRICRSAIMWFASISSCVMPREGPVLL